MKVWINGRFVDEKKAKVSVFDRGFLYGDGLFETMRCYAGLVFKLDEHLKRLFESLKIITIESPYSKGVLRDAIYKILKTDNLTNAYIRLAITRGEGRFGISHQDAFRPNVVIVAKEFEGYPAWMHSKGIRAKVSEVRQNEHSPLSRIKSLNFLSYILARLDAKRKRADEAILLNSKGHVAEAATSNIFLVKKSALITPSLESGILPGITRSAIIKIAKGLRIKVQERAVARRELMAADEVFLTNSLAEVIPVVKINSKSIGDGLPGDITKLVHISYQKQVICEVLR